MKTAKFWIPYFFALSAIFLATCLGYFFQSMLPTRDLIMFYLLAVVVVAFSWGRGPAIAASLASVAIFDFLFVPPQFGFIPIHKYDWVALVSLLTVALIISHLTSRVRTTALKIELLHEKEKLQSVLLNSISHDLKTPLVTITGALSSLAEDEKLDEKNRRELITAAFEEAERLNHLVGNLLDMTRVETGAMHPSAKLCDVQDMIGAALQCFPKKELEAHPVQIHITPGLPDIAADYTLMLKALVNVLDNAFKYSPPGSPVEIEAKIAGDYVNIVITDKGPGIPQKDLTKIFDKFYRVKQTEKIPGIGLGLAISKGIVEAHRGKIRAEHLPLGASIILSIPYNPNLTGKKP